jgi:hypothetical protein
MNNCAAFVCQDCEPNFASTGYIEKLPSMRSTLNEHGNEKLPNIEDLTTTSLSVQHDSTLQHEPYLFQQLTIDERHLYFRRTPLGAVQINIKEASIQLGKDLKKLNSLRKEKGYGKATAEGFAQLGISRLYEITEYCEKLLWMFTEKNILKDNPQRKERCISLLEELHPKNVENNKELMKLVNSTRPMATIDQKVETNSIITKKHGKLSKNVSQSLADFEDAHV